MKNLAHIFFALLLLSWIASGCRTSNLKGREDFEIFYERFLTDSAFQMQRVQFPLPGFKAGEEEDTAYHWTKEEWIILQKPDLDTTDFQRRLQVSDTLATDEIFMEGTGFYFKMVYEPIQKKWHLVYLVDSEL